MGEEQFFQQSMAPGVHADRLAAIHTAFVRAWGDLLMRAGDGTLEPPADRRFKSDAWAGQPHALLAAHAYLLMADTLLQLVDVAELGDAARARLHFSVMQWVEAASPANFFALNPEAQQALLNSGGASLQRGMANLLHDLQRGRITQTDESAFAPGENLAVTPGAVVYENQLMQVIHYAPVTPQVYARPLLMVPPCINKYYILDLQPANSLVRHVVESGVDVYMVSWRNPLPADDDDIDRKTWDDYVQDGVLQAVEVVRSISRQPRINALGFCVGGTLLATALAVARARGDDPVAALTLLTSFLDFEDTGILDVFVDEWHALARDQQLGHGGLMSAAELSTTFSFLRPAELVWNYVDARYLKGEPPKAFDLLAWNADGTNLPGPFFAWYFRNTYLENRLKTGQLRVAGSTVDFGRLDMPAYLYASRDDHIVPWASAYASSRLLGGPSRFVLGESGHIAGVINPPARGRRGYWCDSDADAALPDSAETWLERADHHAGSWWPDWLGWLTPHSGALQRAPRSLGNRRFSSMEPAPGRYVKVRAD